MRAQKKLLGKMATKKIAKVFIDDTSGRVLDHVYKAAKEYSGSKKTAEKLMKDIIKIVIKIGILYRNEQFNPQEMQIADRFRSKFRSVIMTIISFYEVDFTFDKNFLNSALSECQSMLKELVVHHLTDKSLGRIDNVFGFFGNTEFLASVFRSDSLYRKILSEMVDDLNKMLEDGTL